MDEGRGLTKPAKGRDLLEAVRQALDRDARVCRGKARLLGLKIGVVPLRNTALRGDKPLPHEESGFGSFIKTQH